jgi:hypothetical protein
MPLALIFILTFIVYLINRKKFTGKTAAQKIWTFGIYALCVLAGLFVFFEILHIIKYHEISL